MKSKVKANLKDHEKAVEYFLSNPEKPKQFGKFFVYDKALVYRDALESYNEAYRPDNNVTNIFPNHDNRQMILKVVDTIIAAKIRGLIVGNSSMLDNVGSRQAFGHYVRNRSETPIQQYLAKKTLMIPFASFKEAGLSLTELEIIERGKPEMITRKETRYNDKGKKIVKTWQDRFTGACLFKVKDQYYLLDIDRQELKHGLFNAFITSLPSKANTIKEAYEVLKPKEVKDAEKKGLKVKRQGEFFFIPVKIQPKTKEKVFGKVLKTTKELAYAGRDVEFLRLQSKDNGNSHIASMGFLRSGEFLNETAYVKGTIRHTGREHKDLVLGNEWHMAIANTATKNVTLKGDID